jgi:tRNA pseudouridine-54 N-methylase
MSIDLPFETVHTYVRTRDLCSYTSGAEHHLISPCQNVSKSASFRVKISRSPAARLLIQSVTSATFLERLVEAEAILQVVLLRAPNKLIEFEGARRRRLSLLLRSKLGRLRRNLRLRLVGTAATKRTRNRVTDRMSNRDTRSRRRHIRQ